MPVIDLEGLPDKEPVEAAVVAAPSGIDFEALPDKEVSKGITSPERLPRWKDIQGKIPANMQGYEQDAKDSISAAATYDLDMNQAYNIQGKLKEELGESDLWDKAQASFKAGMGDVYVGMGNTLKWAGMDEAFSDVYVDFGERMRDAYIPAADQSEFSWRKTIDPEWWATTVTRSVPFTLSLIPAAVVGAYVGAAGAGAASLGTFGTTVVTALGGAAASRPLESAFEAAAAYETALARGDSEEDASSAADKVFASNMLLVGMDAAQFAVAFTPLKFGKGLKSSLMRRMSAGTGKLSAVAISEAGEERYQEYVQMEALGEEANYFDLDNPRLNEASTIGGIFGAGMGGAGSVWNALTKKTTEGMPEDVQKTFDTAKAAALADGVDEAQAMREALDAVADTPEGKEHIETILNDMKEKASVEMPVEGKPEISAPTIEELFEKLKTEDLTEEELGGLLDQFAGGREIIEEVQAEPVAEIKERLLATGMDEAEATANAALFDGFRVLAQRAGVSVEDVMERYLPEVAREGVEEVAVPVVTEEERRAITDNPFLSDQITTEEQLTDVESLRAARERINETLVEQREEQTVSDEEMLQLGEAVSFLDEKIAAPSPEALAQPLQEGVTPEAPRGRIRIFPDSVGIELLKDADMSTFGHETGHLYLRMMQDLSSLETASEDLKADFETLKTWLNYEEGQIGYTEDQQEQFARGFEAYLREGKAPSSALAEAFENFKQWLMQIYKSLRDLNVKLTDEVRGVMDRMLADEGIEREEIVPAEEVLEQKAIPLPVDEQEFWRLAANSKEWSELNIDEMDRAAFGFSEEDITTLEPDQLNIKWQQDYDNVIEEQKDSGLSREEYARRIDLTEPIEVIYEDRQFKVDDGYHRWFAARVLNKTLNVTLEIKAKPHRTIIENAIINGKEVTNEVLAPYPDLIEARNKDELADYVKRLLAEPVEIPKPEVFEQAPKITNIRQLAKSLGGIDYNREHLKGELDKLKEDAPATKLIINKRGQGITLDRLRESAIEIGILTEEATLDDVLSALEVNLETAGAIEEDIVKDERIRSKIETREYEAAELKEEFIKVSQRARKAFREGRAAGVEKEAQKLKNILARARKLRIVRDYLNLTDADMKKLTTKNPLLMDQWEFKKFIDDLRVRAVELSETKLQKAMLIHMIHSKDLSNVDNYRKVLGLPAITKMTTGQAREFALALEPFEDGSSFLTVRQLQLIDRTELEGARTYEEAKAILSEKTGMSIEDLSKISITEWTKFKWDTSLAESDPFLNLLVRGVNEKLLEANIRAFDIETKVHDLAKKSEKSRPRTFIEKIIPQDKLIFQYLEAPADEKADVMANMTKEQLDLAHYMQEYFSNALKYLIKVKGLEQGRENYITHVRRGMLENIKEEGLSKAVDSMFTALQEDYAVFNIGTDQHILPLDKFFQYEMRRTGVIAPSENVIKVFLQYVNTFEKMVSLNEIMPVMDIYAQSITPQKYTPKGLEMDKSIKNFVHDYINNKKGRRITAAVIDKQGGVIDISLRAGKTVTSFLDLGWNIYSGLAATGGEQITNYQMLGLKRFAKGNKRIGTKKGKAILEKYAAVIGRSSWEGMFAPGEDIIDRTMTSAFALFNEASRLANSQFLLGSITDLEYNKGEISSGRMTELLLDMGRFRVVPGTKSLVGSTSLGGTLTQYKTWAIPVLRTNLKNLIDTGKNLKNRPVGEALSQREAIEIYRLAGITLTAYIVWAMAGVDEEDDSFAGQLLNKVKRETFTLIQAVDPTLFFGDPRLSSFLQQLAKNIKMSLFLEEYKTKQGFKGIEGLKKQLTPRAVKQFMPKPKKKERL